MADWAYMAVCSFDSMVPGLVAVWAEMKMLPPASLKILLVKSSCLGHLV